MAKKLQDQGFSIFGELLGLDTQVLRTNALIEHLRAHPEIKALVAHSAGCITTIEALRMAWLQSHIKEVVLMNSGPLPGTAFMPWDPVSWVTLKHLPELATGSPLALTKSDAKSLLGERINMDDLAADSGSFIRSVLGKQLPWKKPQIEHLQHVPNLAAVFSRGDRILGSTGEKTKHQLMPFTSTLMTLTIGDGHMYPMQNLDVVLDSITF